MLQKKRGRSLNRSAYRASTKKKIKKVKITLRVEREREGERERRKTKGRKERGTNRKESRERIAELEIKREEK